MIFTKSKVKITFFRHLNFIIIFKGGKMYKVKIFDEEHELDLEDAINKFLKNHNIELIDIKYSVAAFTSIKEEQVYCYSALLIYK